MPRKKKETTTTQTPKETKLEVVEDEIEKTTPEVTPEVTYEQLDFETESFCEAKVTVSQKRITDLCSRLKKDSVESITLEAFSRNLGYRSVTDAFTKDLEAVQQQSGIVWDKENDTIVL